MIYEEALSYIHSLLKFGVRPGLSRMDTLLKRLGNPHKNQKYVHVAGTNGKGSVSTALSNVLTDAGLNVGLYTSPFVTDFLERIQYNGLPVDRNIFCTAVEKVKNAVENLKKEDIVITEFEALTASAFLCFKSLGCDIIVLEVGLGGRLDATNVIDRAEVDIITSLSLDHTAILGDTLEKIAYEKCGILRENSDVVLSACQQENACNTVKRIAEEKECNLVVPDFNKVSVISSSVFGTQFIYKNKKYKTSMPGSHQLVNMTSVTEASYILKNKGYNITQSNIYNGILKTKLPARCEVLSMKPLVILDGGHNEDGAKAFYDAVCHEFKKKNKVYVIAGMMADKAVEKSLSPLIQKSDCFVAVTPVNPRAMKSSELKCVAEKYCSDVKAVDDVNVAVREVFSQLSDDDMLCVVGSLYLAGEVREALLNLVKGDI